MRSSTVKVHMKIHEGSTDARIIKLTKNKKKAVNMEEEKSLPPRKKRMENFKIQMIPPQFQKEEQRNLNLPGNRVFKPQPISSSLNQFTEHNFMTPDLSRMIKPYSVCGTIQSSMDCGAFELLNRAQAVMAFKKIPIMLPSFSTLKPKESLRPNRLMNQASGINSKHTSIALNYLNKKILSQDDDKLFS